VKIFKVILHAIMGGFVAGMAGFSGGSSNLKTLLLAGAGSALTSVISLFSDPPGKVSIPDTVPPAQGQGAK
jgi:hypothetical protein